MEGRSEVWIVRGEGRLYRCAWKDEKTQDEANEVEKAATEK